MSLRDLLPGLAGGLALVIAALPAQAADKRVGRGQYIVERLGLCIDCHTPRGEHGMLVAGKALQGAPIGFRPTEPMPFAEYAPRLAGLPHGWTETQLVAFLQTGRRPDGSEPRPPMPAYRMDAADAQAVAAYLKSLPVE